MAKKIDAATKAGIDLFLFDWYWYSSPQTPMITTDSQGPGGGTFLSGALEKGFLKAANRNKMKFALMWANQVRYLHTCPHCVSPRSGAIMPSIAWIVQFRNALLVAGLG